MPIFENGEVRLDGVRLSFPHLHQPHKSAANAQPKYSCDVLLPEQGPQAAELWQVIQQVAYTEWGDQAEQILQLIYQDRKLRSFGWGQEKIDKKTLQPYTGYPGQLYVTLSNADEIELYNAQAARLPITSPEAKQLFLGGYYVNAHFQVWAQNNEHGRGIRIQGIGLMFVDKGELFGSAPATSEGIFQPVAGAPAAVAPVGAAPGAPAPQPMAQPAPVVQPAPQPTAQPAVQPAPAPAGVPVGAPPAQPAAPAPAAPAPAAPGAPAGPGTPQSWMG